ncbi:MAG: ribokinase [Woeseia sp.]|nr:ribokinase [Woeseia sp.]NNE61410.1 ribokinase [Woeseia sp.]
MTASAPHIVVVGSVNLDMTVRVRALPRPGETVTNGELHCFPGGKGANQALAARRLGAKVSLIACVGDDTNAEAALHLLKADGVDLTQVTVDSGTPTGVAMITVDDEAENQIVVAPGANRRLTPQRVAIPDAVAMICQLEVPLDTLLEAASQFSGFLCINLAPVRDVPAELIARADLIVVNEIEAAHYGETLHRAAGMVALTYGRRGASLLQGAVTLAKRAAHTVNAVDTTGAGDTFTAALVLALVEGQAPEEALAFACTAAALSAERAGAQPSMPRRADVLAILEP